MKRPKPNNKKFESNDGYLELRKFIINSGPKEPMKTNTDKKAVDRKKALDVFEEQMHKNDDYDELYDL